MDKAEETAYALKGKMMLIAVVILFIVIIIMLCLHVYVRWYLRRVRRRQHLRRNRYSRRAQLVFYVDPSLSAVSRGLDASVIASLPVFAFSSKTQPDPVECAVCLSEFVDGETGRVLPKCNHSFHIDCIDMWFQSHSTCPICRGPVESQPQPEVAVIVSEPEPGSGSGLSQQGGEEVNRTGPTVTSSSSSIEKSSSSFVGVAVRSESLGDESGYDSPPTQSSFRTPMSRMMSLKRILSRERKASSGCVTGCNSMAELDADQRRGREETQ